MDFDCVLLCEYLEFVVGLLDQFEFEEMCYYWCQWIVFDCNWKMALEVFMEFYYVEGMYFQLCVYGDFYVWSKVQGLYGYDGFDLKDLNDMFVVIIIVM